MNLSPPVSNRVRRTRRLARFVLPAVCMVLIACSRNAEPPASVAVAPATVEAPAPVPRTVTVSSAVPAAQSPTNTTKPSRPDTLLELLPSRAELVVLADVAALTTAGAGNAWNPLGLAAEDFRENVLGSMMLAAGAPEFERLLTAAAPAAIGLAYDLGETDATAGANLLAIVFTSTQFSPEKWSAENPSGMQCFRSDLPNEGSESGQPNDAAQHFRCQLGALADEKFAFQPDGELWGALSAEATISVYVRELAPLTREGANLHFLSSLRPKAAAISVGQDGAVRAVVSGEELGQFPKMLGAGQTWLAQALGQLARSSESASISWLSRISETSWSLVRFAGPGMSDEQKFLSIDIPAPKCGSVFGNLTVAAIVAGSTELGTLDPTIRDAEYRAAQSWAAPDCAEAGGVAPALPRNVEWLFGEHSTGDSLVILGDVNAISRRIFPTLFGMLPFALPPAIWDSVGADTFGAASTGSTPVAVWLSAAAVQGRAWSTVVFANETLMQKMSPEALDEAYGQARRQYLAHRYVEGVGVVLASPGIDVVQWPAANHGRASEFLARIPENAVLSMIFPEATTASMFAGISGERTWLTNAKFVAISWTAAGQLVLQILAEKPPTADTVRAELPQFLAAATPSTEFAAVVWAKNAEEIQQSLTRGLASASIEVDGDFITIVADAPAQLIAGFVPWIAPRLATLIKRGHIPMPNPGAVPMLVPEGSR